MTTTETPPTDEEMPELVHWQPTHHRPLAGTTSSRAATVVNVGAAALGAVAVGALAIGALAIGRLAIGRMFIGRARIGDLEIDRLTVRRLTILEP